MTPNTNLNTDPRTLSANANLPTANEPTTILGVTLSFLSLAVIAVALRVWIRIRDRLWGWDDFFVVLACVTSIVGDTMVCLMPADGLGLHLWTLNFDNLISFFKHIYSTNIAYCTSSAFIKLSILFQYLRLFSESADSKSTSRYKLARRVTWALIVLSFMWGMGFALLAAFSCTPIAKNWNPTLPGRCIGWGTKNPGQFFAIYMGHAVSNSVLDVLVLMLPLPFLTMMRLGGKSKAGLITLYALGCLVGVFAVARMIALSIKRAGTIPIPDMTYYTPIIYIFGVLEVNIAIIAASIPTFWPAIAKFATNRIFVVNEVVIQVESAPRESFTSDSAIVHDGKDVYAGPLSNNYSGVTRTVSNFKDQYFHQTKPSNTSSSARTIALDLGRRASQDSQRKLYHTTSSENRSSTSLSGNEEEDWFRELDKINNGKTTTTIERTAIPLEHIKALDRT
ncbi:hypothetical protein ACN47E_000718 [Coniothyrium glycines]